MGENNMGLNELNRLYGELSGLLRGAAMMLRACDYEGRQEYAKAIDSRLAELAKEPTP